MDNSTSKECSCTDEICKEFQESMYKKYGREIIFCHGDKTFEQKQKVFNARFNSDDPNQQPCMVAECKEAKEVVDCIKFAKQHDICLRIKSGGHNHAGWSTGKRTLVIHLAKTYEDIEFNADLSEAWIPPGSRLGNVYKVL